MTNFKIFGQLIIFDMKRYLDELLLLDDDEEELEDDDEDEDEDDELQDEWSEKCSLFSTKFKKLP